MKHFSSEQKHSLIENFYNLFITSLDAIHSSSSSPGEITNQQRNNLQILFYFFLQLVISLEQSLKSSSQEISSLTKTTKVSSTKSSTKKKISSSEFNWVDWRTICLNYLQKYLSFDQTKLWPMGIIEENVLMLLWKYMLQLLEEKPVGMNGTGKTDVAIRKVCQEILTQCVKQLEKQCSHSTDALSSFLTALIDSICRYEHMANNFAEICCVHSQGSNQVCTEIMKEIGRINMTELSKSNATGVKNIGGFLVTLGEIAPQITTQYLPFILNHLDSEAYQIR